MTFQGDTDDMTVETLEENGLLDALAKSRVARLMSAALGGQTLLGRSAYNLARGAGVDADGIRWEAHGEYRLKGVEHPVEVFEVGVAGKAPFRPPPGTEKV
jgi:class 3 adenylate cyclase